MVSTEAYALLYEACELSAVPIYTDTTSMSPSCRADKGGALARNPRWCTYCTLHNRVEWFTPFCDFQNGTHCCRSDMHTYFIFVRVGNSLFGFLCQLLVFLEQKCKILNAFCTLLVMSKWLRPIFFKERAERIPLLLWARRANEKQIALLFWAYKGEKHVEKNEFEANLSLKMWITLKKRVNHSQKESESLLKRVNHYFLKSNWLLFVLYLKMTVTPIALYLTLIRVALEENLQLLFKTILHHDALS